MQHPISNHNNVAEYQCSSIPYAQTLTVNNGSTYHLEFPFVTRFLVINSTETCKLLFSATGESDGKTNYFLIQSGSQGPRLEVKVREIYIKNSSGVNSTVSILAGLTNIPYRQFPDLSGITGVG